MHEQTSPQPVTASPDKATVVFVRHSGLGGRLKTTILDETGRFLGEDWGSTYFTAQVTPGDHVFIAWAENTAALKATLAAGKTYFVEVEPRMGALSARVHLLAVSPKSPKFAQVRGWMAESQHIVTDETAGQAYLQRRAADVQERIRRAQEALTKYSAEELGERTLGADDGT
jgi:hypothetical protein